MINAKTLLWVIAGLSVLLSSIAHCANDKEQANAYDNEWKANWVTHCRSVLQGAAPGSKTAGFVLQVGDSITNDIGYSDWPRIGSGKTAEDSALCEWAKTTTFPAVSNDTSNKNGFYLATAATKPGIRGMTAARGLNTAEFISGNGNGGNAMPSTTDSATAKSYVADGTTYTSNLHYETVSAAFSDSQAAVLMLGTNDVVSGRAATDFIANITTIVNKFESKNIVVILSTIPPVYDSSFENAVAEYNNQIRSFAKSHHLPLIDFYAEILARRPGISWNGTLLQPDDLHPSLNGASFTTTSDPYSPGGKPGSHATGDAALNVGYLLRSWLTIQKLKEIHDYVINGNDPIPTVQFVSTAVTAAESAGFVNCDVNLNFATISSTVTVNFATTDGSASGGGDYKSASGTLTFAPGDTQKTITVNIVNDMLDEDDKTFLVTFSAPNGAKLGAQSTATITIVDDDPPPQVALSASAYNVSESSGFAEITVLLNRASGKTVSLLAATEDQIARAGSDYIPVSQTLMFAPGETLKTVAIQILDNNVDDGDRSFTIDLSAVSNATLGTSSGIVTIINDDFTSVGFKANQLQLNENQSQIPISVVLALPANHTVTVDFGTANGTAIAGSDYYENSGTLTFLPGETTKDFTVVALDDLLSEDDETLTLYLANPVGAQLGMNSSAVLTLNDNDPLPNVCFSEGSYSVGENAGVAILSVKLSAAAGRVTTVDFFTIDETAMAGLDYQSTSGTLNFPPGSISETISIPILRKQTHTPPRELSILISNPKNCNLGAEKASLVISPSTGLILTSTPTALPNPVAAFEAVQFTAVATDSGGHEPEYTWDFGDGQLGIGSSPIHIFVTPGIYTVVLTVGDGGASVTAVLSVNVTAANVASGFDWDGDGFANDLELALGTDPLDATSTPFNGTPASFEEFHTTGRTRIKADFTKPGKDRIELAGALTLNEPPEGNMTVFVGGVARTFAYAQKPAKSPDGVVAFRTNTKRPLDLKVSIKMRGTFAATLWNHGAMQVDRKTSVQVPTYILFDGTVFKAIVTPAYSVRRPKTQ